MFVYFISDVYVRITLRQGGRHLVAAKRTSPVISSSCITYNESLDFNINVKQLDSYSAIVSVVMRTQGLKGR